MLSWSSAALFTFLSSVCVCVLVCLWVTDYDAWLINAKPQPADFFLQLYLDCNQVTAYSFLNSQGKDEDLGKPLFSVRSIYCEVTAQIPAWLSLPHCACLASAPALPKRRSLNTKGEMPANHYCNALIRYDSCICCSWTALTLGLQSCHFHDRWGNMNSTVFPIIKACVTNEFPCQDGLLSWLLTMHDDIWTYLFLFYYCCILI